MPAKRSRTFTLSFSHCMYSLPPIIILVHCLCLSCHHPHVCSSLDPVTFSSLLLVLLIKCQLQAAKITQASIQRWIYNKDSGDLVWSLAPGQKSACTVSHPITSITKVLPTRFLTADVGPSYALSSLRGQPLWLAVLLTHLYP